MTRFLDDTMADLRGGRETWRVFLITGAPALVASILAALLV